MYKVYWDVRKGLIPLVGSSAAGTSVLIEDVACEVDKLGDMTQDLIDMFNASVRRCVRDGSRV